MTYYWSLLIFLFCPVFAAFSPAISAESSAIGTLAPETIVRAGIGIEIRSNNQIKSAKLRNTLKKKDLLRVHVLPAQACYIYIIHTDQEMANLVNPGENKIGESVLYVIPPNQNFFQIDGKSDMEKISIICSPQKNKDIIERFRNGAISYFQWKCLETILSEKSKIDLTESPQKSFTLAGNLRGVFAKNNNFMDCLKYFSGRYLLIKTYEFRTEK